MSASISFASNLYSDQIESAYHNSYNYEKAGNYTDAIKAIQLILEKHPKTYTVNSRLGYFYRLNNQFPMSILHYRNAVNILPNSITSKLGLQYTYLLAKNFPKSLEISYQIISSDYYNFYGNYRLAYTLVSTEKYDLAEKVINKMLVLYPTDVLFLTELGLLQIKQSKLDMAKITLYAVLILDPENIRANSALLGIK
jgi:tetratricopeptide (TPR) repeat protein